MKNHTSNLILDPDHKKNKTTNHGHSKISLLMQVIGPGSIVMLADTDAGSIITAAQSGAVWGYQLLLLQLVLIPILYIVQELTIRLGLVTGKGYGELILQHFGKFWAWFSVGTLLICCIGALIAELSGIVGVGNLFGISPSISMILTITFLILLVFTKSYTSVEKIALACGAFELVYLVIAWQAHPSSGAMIQSISNIPLQNNNYLYFAAANIGAVIMPWMIFYQQSAIADKKLKIKHLKFSRIETAIGAVITQVVMSAIIIALAATIGKGHEFGLATTAASLKNIEQISAAITPFLGDNIGRVMFALGMLGASLIATIVVLLTAAWSVGELIGWRRSLQDKPREAPWFYGIYFVILLLGSVLVSSGIQLVNLNVAVEVMNALLLPIVLGFLFLLARKALPDHYRIKGWYALLVGTIIALTSSFSMFAGLKGIFGN